MQLRRVIISGGGTGGHIFPALAIADQIKLQFPDCDILFVGAEGKMEMERVPKAGYKIVGLNIRGLQRKLSLENLKFPYRVVNSLWKAKKIIKEFKPQIAIGVGGYASGPLLIVAAKNGIPTLIQEQNSYAGLTNKMLANKVKHVCTAYEEAKSFFPKAKVTLTGNPVRANLKSTLSQNEAKQSLGLDSSKPLVLVVGGSLGAGAINDFLITDSNKVTQMGATLFWQTGKSFWNANQDRLETVEQTNKDVKVAQFIDDMATAYAAADIVISRAGAIAISELQVLGKSCVLVPSPFVAENHQYKNAQALVRKNAAVLVEQKDLQENLLPELSKLLENPDKRSALSTAIAEMAKPKATEDIVKIIVETANNE